MPETIYCRFKMKSPSRNPGLHMSQHAAGRQAPVQTYWLGQERGGDPQPRGTTLLTHILCINLSSRKQGNLPSFQDYLFI